MKVSIAVKITLTYNMSHEIRTPLNEITGFNELLLDNSLGDDKQVFAMHMAKNGNDLLKHHGYLKNPGT